MTSAFENRSVRRSTPGQHTRGMTQCLPPSTTDAAHRGSFLQAVVARPLGRSPGGAAQSIKEASAKSEAQSSPRIRIARSGLSLRMH
jgi:hypothetical protein